MSSRFPSSPFSVSVQTLYSYLHSLVRSFSKEDIASFFLAITALRTLDPRISPVKHTSPLFGPGVVSPRCPIDNTIWSVVTPSLPRLAGSKDHPKSSMNVLPRSELLPVCADDPAPKRSPTSFVVLRDPKTEAPVYTWMLPTPPLCGVLANPFGH